MRSGARAIKIPRGIFFGAHQRLWATWLMKGVVDFTNVRFWPKADIPLLHMSAFGGKADKVTCLAGHT